MPETARKFVDSPIGKLLLVAEGPALAGVHLPPHPETKTPAARPAAKNPVLERAARELAEYFAGKRRKFTVPLAMHGTGFQLAVWGALREIPFGECRSYADIAASIGRPKAVRAVGLANGANPVAIIVPCHRVIGSDGSLTGYGGGLPMKQWLLDLESGV